MDVIHSVLLEGAAASKWAKGQRVSEFEIKHVLFA